MFPINVEKQQRTPKRLKIIFYFIIFFLLYLLSPMHSALATTTPSSLKFVYTRPPDHPVSQWLIMIYTEALRRIDIQFIFHKSPPKRASLYSDKGVVDGELGRIYDYASNHPNMIRIEEHHALITFSAFSLDSDLSLNGWDSFIGSNYPVEYRLGIKKSETELPLVIDQHRLTAIGTVHQGIQKLIRKRTKVYVDVEDFVRKYLNSDEFQQISKGQTVHMVGVMETISGHAFLHKKHEDLVPQLSKILKELKTEGLFEKYRDMAGLNEFDIRW